ncbi:uncharacterized protein LOC119653933 [Hermetia illucens]|uniref:uncharacterized protein LOC119653933 n=1 Tax=Hermetia illucens TaxID=343691 RepID=UPI0018CC0B36|nr:uncharacterized protein LOC119653933 [Hermetia illucens]
MAEVLLKHQQDIAKEREIIERNYKKDGPSRKTDEYYSRKINRLNELVSIFRSNHQQLLLLLDPEDPYFELYKEVEAKFASFKDLMEKDRYQLPTKIPTSLGPEGLSTAVTPSANENQRYDLSEDLPKLPAIQIPLFTGLSKEWSQFIELFKSVIHENRTLKNIQKLQYLLGYLRGEAKEAVAHLQLTSSNYEAALLILEERFSNPRQVATEYLDSILDIKKLDYRSTNDVISMYNTIRNCLAGLQNLGYATSHWDPIIIRIIMRKFDTETLRSFEENLGTNKDFTSVENLCSFLLKRYQLLSTIKQKPTIFENKNNFTHPQQKKKSFLVSVTAKPNCILCKGKHRLFACEKFKQFEVEKRIDFANSKNLCLNCLSHGNSLQCKSKLHCFECNGPHHTLLHKNSPINSNFATKQKNSQKTYTVILATALIKVNNKTGGQVTIGTLIDPGSQISFITQAAANRLGLQKYNVLAEITGIGGIHAATIRKKINVHISSTYENKFNLSTDMHIMTLPEKSMKLERPTWVNTLQLADPNFENSMNIDAILGADVYEHIVEPEIKKGEVLLAQKTKLGWVLLGKIPIITNNLINASANITTAEFQQKMERFFDMNEKETEQPDQKEIPEIIYQSTTVREPNGRYLVALPFKDDNKVPPLGNSRNKALIIYKQLEKRLNRDPKLKKAYNEVQQEYLYLGHMKEVPT